MVRISACARQLCVLGVLASLLAVAAEAQGDGSDYVMRDGTTYRMVQSDSELAIVLRDTGEAGQATVRRLAASGRGVVRDLWEDPGVHIKLVSVADTSDYRRDRIATDENIEEVRSVYYFEGQDVPVIPSGQLIFKINADVSEAELDAMLEEYDLVEVEEAEGLHRVYLARPDDGGDGVAAAADLASDPRVEWSQPNLISRIESRQATSIQDQYYTSQWHLQTIDAPEAWLLAEGGDILFGMFDDSVDVLHEDLRDNYIGTGHDASLPSNDSGFTDPRPKLIGDRHGTAVMGLAVAAGNEFGVRGVAHQARFTASRGLSQALTDFEIASVFTFARQQNVDVHINSWGLDGRPNPEAIVEAIETAFLEGRDVGGNPLGMVILFATGNDDEENDANSDLSSLETVIAVGATNDSDARASYSNYGAFPRHHGAERRRLPQ